MKRICKKCGVEKEIEEFRKCKICINGRSYTCKICYNLQTSKWGLSEKGKSSIKLSNKKYRILNKKEESKRNKEWSKKHKGRRMEKDHINVLKLSDSYIKKLFVFNTKLKRSDIPQCLVNLKRDEIRAKRLLKELTS